MKNFLALFSIILIFAFFSCKSTPAPEPTPKPEPSSKENVQQEIPQEIQQEISQEQSEDLDNKKSFSDQNKQLFETASAARTEAENAGAKKSFSQKFDEIDRIYDLLKKSLENDPDSDYSKEIHDLKAKYNALENAAKARTLKTKIDEKNLSQYDKLSYEAGENALLQFDSMPSDSSGEDFLKVAQTAYDSYEKVYTTGLKNLVAKERSAALNAKKQADGVRAAVSRKVDYKIFADIFAKADSNFVTKNLEGALDGYAEAKNGFLKLFEEVSRARNAAQEAVDRAKKRISQSENYATTADEIAPPNETTIGIENESAVLLEKDDFSASENAEIDLESSEDAKTARVQLETLNLSEDFESEKIKSEELGAEESKSDENLGAENLKSENLGAEKSKSDENLGAEKSKSGELGAERLGSDGNLGAEKSGSGNLGVEKLKSDESLGVEELGSDENLGVEKSESGNLGAENLKSGELGAENLKSENLGAEELESDENLGVEKSESNEELGAEKLGSDENLGAEKLESEELGAEKLGSDENLGAEKLESEELGAEKSGSDENLGVENLKSGELGAEKSESDESLGAEKSKI